MQQAYLNNFANQRGNDYYFYVYNVKENMKIPDMSNVYNFAQESYFYDFNFIKSLDALNISKENIPEKILRILEKSDMQFIENFFSDHIEAKLFPSIKKIIDIPYNTVDIELYTALSPDIKVEIAYYIAFQMIRTRTARNQIRKDLSQLKTNEIELEILARFEHIKQIISIPEIETQVRALCNNYVWMVGINHLEELLFTSDNPVVIDDYAIYFPLNSYIILILYKAHLDNFGYITYDSKFITIKENGLKKYNNLQFKNANRFVFCQSDQFYNIEK